MFSGRIYLFVRMFEGVNIEVGVVRDVDSSTMTMIDTILCSERDLRILLGWLFVDNKNAISKGLMVVFCQGDGSDCNKNRCIAFSEYYFVYSSTAN